MKNRRLFVALALAGALVAPALAQAADSDAKPKTQVAPTYPVDAVRKQISGWVELEFNVDPTGKVTGVSVVKAQPIRVFEQEAVKAMKQWTFEPAVKDGQPVASRARRKIEFTL